MTNFQVKISLLDCFAVMIGRDHDKKMGIEEATFNIHGRDDVEKVLQLYDIKTAVYIRG